MTLRQEIKKNRLVKQEFLFIIFKTIRWGLIMLRMGCLMADFNFLQLEETSELPWTGETIIYPWTGNYLH